MGSCTLINKTTVPTHRFLFSPHRSGLVCQNIEASTELDPRRPVRKIFLSELIR